VRRKKPPLKKKFPFYSKVAGDNARRRPDRKAMQAGGAVSSLADGEIESPNEPNAPVGGAVRQKFKDGGGTDKWIQGARESMERRGTVGSLRKAMGVKGKATIPTGKLEAKKAAAERSGNTKMIRKVQFALNVRK
jgi:hypothetical protein